ncbi:hypothetical protein [Actinoplanes derwentensis]|uniref:YbaB/EbfC DNA-binding family protein n=1 Tax=Actinoplanes derwentensis TaxID=113562 RepID=A0A1H2CYK1_9ACTN|nr:hypothetical protein [Actinoplanes derwentensis]GID82893.1 hypothetical protein Ade03nite_18170 [Actinoplanes derwentensis]SDT75357.1 hypothetical protein SAMN04489716_7276 [Actinoplanes derwentensis]
MGVTRETDSVDCIAATGEGADGLVRIELDGAGQLWDVVLDPQITELSVAELRTALFDAITEASANFAASSFAEESSSFAEAVADATGTAERRFAEISEALHGISRRRR